MTTCEALTQKGTRCKRKPTAESVYCATHVEASTNGSMPAAAPKPAQKSVVKKKAALKSKPKKATTPKAKAAKPTPEVQATEDAAPKRKTKAKPRTKAAKADADSADVAPAKAADTAKRTRAPKKGKKAAGFDGPSRLKEELAALGDDPLEGKSTEQALDTLRSAIESELDEGDEFLAPQEREVRSGAKPEADGSTSSETTGTNDPAAADDDQKVEPTDDDAPFDADFIDDYSSYDGSIGANPYDDQITREMAIGEDDVELLDENEMGRAPQLTREQALKRAAEKLGEAPDITPEEDIHGELASYIKRLHDEADRLMGKKRGRGRGGRGDGRGPRGGGGGGGGGGKRRRRGRGGGGGGGPRGGGGGRGSGGGSGGGGDGGPSGGRGRRGRRGGRGRRPGGSGSGGGGGGGGRGGGGPSRNAARDGPLSQNRPSQGPKGAHPIRRRRQPDV